MITAPICEFVRRYRYSGALRMHMPGHKGTALLGPEPLDLTEIEGADVLYHAEGIIRESDANAAAQITKSPSLRQAVTRTRSS